MADLLTHSCVRSPTLSWNLPCYTNTNIPTEHLVEFVETRRACSAVIRVIRVVIRTGLLACVHTRYAVEEYYAWDCILNMLDMCDMHLQQLIKGGSTTWHIYQGWPPCLAIDFRFCQIWRKAFRAVKRKEIPSTLFSCKTTTVHVGTRPSQLSIYVQSIYRKLEDVKLVSVGRHVYAVLWEDVGSLR